MQSHLILVLPDYIYRTDYLSEAGYSEEDMKDLTWSRICHYR